MALFPSFYSIWIDAFHRKHISPLRPSLQHFPSHLTIKLEIDLLFYQRLDPNHLHPFGSYTYQHFRPSKSRIPSSRWLDSCSLVLGFTKPPKGHRQSPALKGSTAHQTPDFVQNENIHVPRAKGADGSLIGGSVAPEGMASGSADTVKGDEFERKAEKKLNGWGLFGSKYEDAADLYEKAANSYKLAKNWDKAGLVYVKLAGCHLKMDSKHEAASAYVDAANCYKKISSLEAAQYLNQAVNLFLEIGRLNMAARYSKDIGEIYEQDENLEKAIDFLERAADLFQSEEVTTSANQCKQKVAQMAAQLEQYPKAVEIYEAIARENIKNNLLKYSVKGILLNAGLCQLCRGDVVAIANSLERYQDLDPTFSGTREQKFLADLAASLEEEDVAKFTDTIKEFDSMTRLDSWKATLLLRAKNALKAKEDEDDDLT